MLQSLEDLCIDSIVKRFYFYNAFFSTEDVGWKRRLEFLRRKYSMELITRLTAREDSIHRYIDFLLNNYIKVLDTTWFRNCSWEKVTAKIAEIGPTVETIIFQDVYFEEFSEEGPWQDIICHFPNLKSFTFHDDCHDSIVKNVAKFCLNIEEIDFQNSPVTIEAAKCLCRYDSGKPLDTKLKKLFISGSSIRDDGVKYLLKNLPSLEIIDYVGLPLVLYSLHKNDLSSLDKMELYNITTLNLKDYAHSPFFADLLKVCLSVCPHLKSLTCGLLNKADLNLFPNLPDLEQLDIEGLSDVEININDLLKSIGRKLNTLTIATHCALSVSVLSESCPRLKELVLSGAQFLSDDDSKPMFRSLKSCTFDNSVQSSTESEISLILSSSANLESLSFKRCSLLSSEMAHILRYCELNPVKIISFCSCLIEKEFVTDLLLNCHTLSCLKIHDCYDFNFDAEEELLKFAELLSNKPKIDFSDMLDGSDYDEFLNENYELVDFEQDDYYDYDDDDDVDVDYYDGYDDYDSDDDDDDDI